MTVHRHTKAPWQWMIRPGGMPYLATPHSGQLIVMDFARAGMRGAEPRFAVMVDDQPRGRRGGILDGFREILERSAGELDHPDALLIQAAPEGFETAEATYLALLQMPATSRWRIQNQAVLARLRDYIAEATGRGPEEVQDEYEERALLARQGVPA